MGSGSACCQARQGWAGVEVPIEFRLPTRTETHQMFESPGLSLHATDLGALLDI